VTTGELVRRIGVLGPVLLLVVGTAAYWGTLDAPFIFDDTNDIVDNPHIRSVLPLRRSMSAPDQSTVAGGWPPPSGSGAEADGSSDRPVGRP
jgi:hypothetical protein